MKSDEGDHDKPKSGLSPLLKNKNRGGLTRQLVSGPTGHADYDNGMVDAAHN